PSPIAVGQEQPCREAHISLGGKRQIRLAIPVVVPGECGVLLHPLAPLDVLLGWLPPSPISIGQEQPYREAHISLEGKRQIRLAIAVVVPGECPVLLHPLAPLDALLGRLPRSEEHTSELQSRFDLVCR